MQNEIVRVLKASPGIDPEDRLSTLLGTGFQVLEYDPTSSLADQAADADVLIVRDLPITGQIIDRARRLKLIQRMGEHVVGVDIKYANSRGIPVARVPASPLSSRMVAEHALFLLLALAKRMKASQASVAAGVVGLPNTDGLAGKTLGIVGLGRSGTELAKLARAIGMRVAAVRRRPDDALRRELGLEFLGGMDERDSMLARCDAVSIHVPMNPETRASFSTSAFNAMRPGSWLINVARAGIVDRPALEAALESGHLGGAAFDVFWNEPADPADPLLQHPNFILTPHLAGFTREAEDRLLSVTAENILRVTRGEAPLHQVSAD